MQTKLDGFKSHFANLDDLRVNIHNQWHSLDVSFNED